MTLRYLTTRKAVLVGSLRAALFNTGLMWFVGLVLSIAIGFSIRDFLAEGRGPVLIVAAVILQLVVSVVLIAAGLTAVTLVTLYSGKGRGVLGEHELTISDAGLTEKTEYNETLHRWNGLGEVRESAGYYFVRAIEGGSAFHLIPKDGPILEGNPQAFVAELRRRKNA